MEQCFPREKYGNAHQKNNNWLQFIIFDAGENDWDYWKIVNSDKITNFSEIRLEKFPDEMKNPKHSIIHQAIEEMASKSELCEITGGKFSDDST